MRFCWLVVLSCVVAVGNWSVANPRACADFPELLKQVPDTANIVLLMKSSEIAANASLSASNQIKEFLDAAKSWPVVARWNPQNVVIAAEMNIQHMAPVWQMAAIELEKTPDLKYLTLRTNGVADKLMDYDVVWLENACVLRTGEKQLTFVTPLNRQSATRWLQQFKSQDSVELQPYLAEMADSAAASQYEMVMAIDLENVFRPAEVEKAVADSPLFKKISTNPSGILAGIRGLTVNCRVGFDQDSSINADFSQSVQSLEPIAKPLMIGALTKAGAMLEEINNWDVKVDDQRISMIGRLSPDGMRRILDIFSIHSIASQADAEAVASDSSSPAPANPDPTADAGAADATRVRLATQRYFRNVNTALADIKKQLAKATPEQTALWNANAARKIEQFSVTNVDPQMVQYGQYVVSALNDMIYGIHHSVNQARASADTGYDTPVFNETTVAAVPVRRGYYGGRNRYAYEPMYRQNLNVGAARWNRQAVRDTEIGAANVTSLGIMQEIDGATNEIRKSMSEKYQSQF